MVRKIGIAVVGVLCMVAVCAAVAGAADKIDKQDRKFIVEAAAGGMFEVKAGEMAAQKASNPEVKKFGERMVKDHTAANSELMSIAQSKGVTPPDKLKRGDQKNLDKLSKASGADFDKQYMSIMIKDHKHDIDAFKKEADKGKDPDVKAFAAKTLPTLQDHAQQARTVSGAVGGKTK